MAEENRGIDLEQLRQQRIVWKARKTLGRRIRMEREGLRPVDAILHRPDFGEKLPVIFNMHGGAWIGGDAVLMETFCEKLAREIPAVVVNVNYQKADVESFPYAMDEVVFAAKYMAAHADEYGIDAGRVALLGDSSGGHTVAMGALCGSEERMNIGEHLDMDRTVSACVILYGPNDFEHLVDDRLAEGKKLRPGEGEVPFEAHEMFQDDYKRDPAGMLRDASATAHIVPGRAMPPFMFIQGDEDAIIPVRQGVRFCARVRECGGRAEFFKVAGAQHGRGCWTPQVYAQIVHFLNTYV